jgi:hypothetical protein
MNLFHRLTELLSRVNSDVAAKDAIEAVLAQDVPWPCASATRRLDRRLRPLQLGTMATKIAMNVRDIDALLGDTDSPF